MKVKTIIRKKYDNLSENNRIVIVNVIGSFFVKGLSMIVSFLTVPAYIKFFNGEIVLGVWFTILSVISWVLNFDLGIGNGLRNYLTVAYIEKDFEEAKRLISSAYIVIGAITFIIIVISLKCFDYVSWNDFFKVEKDVISDGTMLLTVKVVFVGIVLQIFFKIISSVLYAIQKSSVNNILSLVTAVIILIAAIFSSSKDNNYNIVYMSVIYDISIVLPYIVASIVIFYKKKYRVMTPSLSSVSMVHVQRVLSLGGYFFFVQVLYMLIMSTNEYIISLLTNSADVVDYKVYFQIFTMGSTIFFLALTPVWSVITKAIAERDIEWIDILYWKLLKMGGGGMLVELLIIPLLQVIFDVWLGEDVLRVNYIYAITFAVLGTLMIFNAVLSSVANGMGTLQTQLIVFLCGASIKFPLAILLVKLTGTWIGVVMATNIALLIYCLVQPITVHRQLKQMRFLKKKTVDKTAV